MAVFCSKEFQEWHSRGQLDCKKSHITHHRRSHSTWEPVSLSKILDNISDLTITMIIPQHNTVQEISSHQQKKPGKTDTIIKAKPFYLADNPSTSTPNRSILFSFASKLQPFKNAKRFQSKPRASRIFKKTINRKLKPKTAPPAETHQLPHTKLEPQWSYSR